MKTGRIVWLAAVLGVAAACTDNDPVASGIATATTVLTDDTGSSAAQLRSADSETAADGSYSGSFSSSAKVEIQAESGAWVELGAPATVNVALQSNGEETTVRSDVGVPVDTYTRVRVTLSGGQAAIDAGATLGGLTLTGAVSIRVGGPDGEVVIEKAVTPFTLNAESNARILVDLNSELWVNESNAEDEEADDQEVQEATEVRQRTTHPS